MSDGRNLEQRLKTGWLTWFTENVGGSKQERKSAQKGGPEDPFTEVRKCSQGSSGKKTDDFKTYNCYILNSDTKLARNNLKMIHLG